MSMINSPSSEQPIHEVFPQPTISATEDEEILAKMMGNVFLSRQEDINSIKENVSELGHRLTNLTEEMGLPPGIHTPICIDTSEGKTRARKVESPTDEVHALLDALSGMIYATPAHQELLKKAKEDGSLELGDLAKELGSRGVGSIMIADKTVDPAKLKKYAVAYLTYNAALRALQIASKQTEAQKKEDLKKREQEDVDKRFEEQAILNNEKLAEVRAEASKKQQLVTSREFSHIVPNTGRGRAAFAVISTPDRKQHADKMNKRMEKSIQKGIEIREKAIDKQNFQRADSEKEVLRRLIDDHQVDHVKIEGPPVAVHTFSQKMLSGG